MPNLKDTMVLRHADFAPLRDCKMLLYVYWREPISLSHLESTAAEYNGCGGLGGYLPHWYLSWHQNTEYSICRTV